MDKQNLNISKIETYLNDILNGVVSDNTFFTTYPNVSVVKASDWKDMVLVDIPSGVRDMDAMGTGTIFIGLYARPLESGRKNVAILSKMEASINEVINTSSNDTYLLKRRLTFTGYDMNIDLHYNVVEITLTIL